MEFGVGNRLLRDYIECIVGNMLLRDYIQCVVDNTLLRDHIECIVGNRLLRDYIELLYFLMLTVTERLNLYRYHVTERLYCMYCK